jgi:tryptophan 2,3-dioxygenase
MRRAMLCRQYVATHLEMLNQMSPWEYHQIRMVLGHGSGFDSPGFRRVPVVTQRVSKAFDRSLERAGLSLAELYQRGREHEELFTLAELLTEWDERIWVWRFRHYTIVARALGEETIGTQGTPVQVLGKLIAQSQIPSSGTSAAAWSSCSTPSKAEAPRRSRRSSSTSAPAGKDGELMAACASGI